MKKIKSGTGKKELLDELKKYEDNLTMDLLSGSREESKVVFSSADTGITSWELSTEMNSHTYKECGEGFESLKKSLNYIFESEKTKVFENPDYVGVLLETETTRQFDGSISIKLGIIDPWSPFEISMTGINFPVIELNVNDREYQSLSEIGLVIIKSSEDEDYLSGEWFALTERSLPAFGRLMDSAMSFRPENFQIGERASSCLATAITLAEGLSEKLDGINILSQKVSDENVTISSILTAYGKKYKTVKESDFYSRIIEELESERFDFGNTFDLKELKWEISLGSSEIRLPYKADPRFEAVFTAGLELGQPLVAKAMIGDCEIKKNSQSHSKKFSYLKLLRELEDGIKEYKEFEERAKALTIHMMPRSLKEYMNIVFKRIYGTRRFRELEKALAEKLPSNEDVTCYKAYKTFLKAFEAYHLPAKLEMVAAPKRYDLLKKIVQLGGEL